MTRQIIILDISCAHRAFHQIIIIIRGYFFTLFYPPCCMHVQGVISYKQKVGLHFFFQKSEKVSNLETLRNYFG